MKAFTTIISILLISISLSLSAQNAPITSLGTISSTALSASVPITAVGFTNISSCALKIVYDPLIATPTNVSIGVGLGGTFDYNIATPGVIIIGWYTTGSLVTLNNSSTLFNISFNKVTNGTTNLNFVDDSNGRACKYTTVVGGVSQTLNDSPLSTYYVPGALTFTNQGPATIAPTLTASVNDNISVPVTVTGFNNVGVVSLTLDYDPAVLSFISGSNTPGGFPNLSFDGTSVPGTIYIGGLESSVTGTTLTDFFTLFTLNFTYLGGTTTLIWNNDYAVNCEYAGSYPDNLTLNDEPYLDYYINGSVGPNPLPTTPTIAVGTIIHPTTCGGNGTIPLTFTNVPAGTYDITYTGGSFTNVNVSGNSTSSSANVTAPAGTYNNLQITVNSVTSAAGVSATVMDPAAPATPTVNVVAAACGTAGSASITNYSSANTYTFTPSGPNVDGSGNITSFTYGLAYTVKAKNASNCESAASLSFTINNALPVPATPTVNVVAAACGTAGSASITNYSSANTYTFTPSGPNVDGSGNITSFTYGLAYTVKAKNASNCESAASLSFTINNALPVPATPTVNVVAAACGTAGSASITNYSSANTYTFTPSGPNVDGSGNITSFTYGLAYTVKAKNASNCESAASLSFTINNALPVPATPTVNVVAAACGTAGSASITNYSSANTYTFTPSGPNVDGSGNITSFTYGLAYTVKAKNASNCESAASLSFTINNALPVPATPTVNVVAAACGTAGSASITNYSSANTYTFTPSGPNVDGSGNITSFTYGLAYTVKAKNADNCESAASASFTIEDALETPAVPQISSTAATCSSAGSSTISNYDAGLTYTFTPAGPAAGAGGAITGMVVGTSYTVTAGNGSCTSVASSSFSNATMLETPAVPLISSTAATCSAAGSSTISNYDAGLTYTFTPAGPAAGAGGAITGMVVGTSYTVTAGNGSCTSVASSSFSNATMLETPAVPQISSTAATCSAAGSSTISNYDAGLTYTFTPAGPAAGAGGAITGMVVGTSYTVTAGNGSCTSVASSSFSNATMLETPAVPQISSTAATCSAAGSSTISNYDAGLTYTFTPAGPAAGAGGAITGMVVGTSYTVTAGNGSCTSVASSSFSNATMLETPAVPQISSTAATCSSAGSSTISNYVAGLTYTFTPSGPAAGAGGLITGMVVGTSYTVTAGNGSCTSVASSSFSNAAMLETPAVPQISSTAATCSSAGSSTISNYDAGLTYTFTPSGPAAGAGGVITGMTVGTSYTVTAGNGSCTSVASSSFSNAAMLETPAVPLISSTAATCSAAGSASITNYDAVYSYLFIPTGPTVNASGNITGFTTGVSYTVKAKNTDNCESAASASFTIGDALDAPLQPAVSVVAATCVAAGSASITNYISGYTYMFTPSDGISVSGSGNITGFTTGVSYTVKAKNADNCESAASASFTIEDALETPAVPLISSTAATCSAAGSSTISNYDAGLTYTFTPSGPAAGAGGAITGMVVGTSYTVTAGNGSCTSVASSSFSNATMLETPAVPQISSTAATCSAAGSSTISNYDAGLTYTFTPAGPAAGAGGAITGMTVGTSYTVTAGNGSCTSVASSSFSNAAMLETPAVPQISSTAATCSSAGSSTISNYVAGLTYTFTPAGPAAGAGGAITGMVVGTSYTVTAGNGSCTSVASSSFSNAAMLETPAVPLISSTAATCSSAGSITISNYVAGLTYTFTPSGPAAGAGGLITGMVVGTSYTVTAGNGSCTSVASSSFSNAAMLETPAVPLISSTVATCSSAGSITISNYVAGLTYTFTPAGPAAGAGGLITGMVVGTSYTVTAGNGSCTSVASASFSNAAMLETPAVPQISSTAATCSAAGSSTISNYVAGLTYTFTPSGPAAGAGGLITGMVVGTSYTVTAGNGSCTSVASSSFSNAAMLETPAVPQISSTAATCSSAGSSTISNYDAGLTYTFTPSGPAAGAGGVITGMTVGTSYTVTAGNGSCTSVASSSFSNAAMLETPAVPLISSTAATCSAAGSASITNYDAVYSYLFIPTGPTVNASGNITGFTTGVSYTVKAKNTDNCESAASASFTIGDALDAPLQPAVSVVAATCVAAGSASITNYISGYTYMFTPSDGISVSGSGNITGFTTGVSYTVKAKNADNCESAASASFTIEDALETPAVPLISSTAATCSAAGSSTISNYDAGLTYTFTPSGPAAGAGGAITGMVVGTSYTVTAGNGSCTSVASSSFSNATMLETPAVPQISSTAATCSAAGSSTISNYDAGLTYTFTPAGPAAGAGGAITGMVVGTSYTVTAGNGSCTSVASSSFSNAAMLETPAVPQISSTAATCSSAGSSTISNYDAGLTYTFTPSGPAAGAGGVITGMTVGTSYTVTAGNGSCTSVASSSFSNAAMLETPAVPLISSTAATCSAAGSSTISNYDAGLTYTFTPAGPAAGAGGAITGIVVGTSYTVTAGNGSCTSVASSSFSNAAMLETPAVPLISSTAATCSAAGSSTISNYDAGLTYTFTPAGPAAGAGGAITGIVVGTSYTVTAGNGSCTSVASSSFSNAAMLETPAVPLISSTAATCSSAGSASITNYDAAYTYMFTPNDGISVSGSGNITGFTTGVSYTVKAKNASNCESAASASFTIEDALETPAVPLISSTAATCSAAGSSTISNYDAGLTYTFTPSGPAAGAGGAITGMVVGTSYTVTAGNGSCTSVASSSFSNATMLETPAVPQISSTAATCSAAGSSTISNYVAGLTYTFTPSGPAAGAGGLITGMVVGTSYTVTAGNGSCTSVASSSFSNAAMLETPAVPQISSTAATCSSAGSSTISNYDAGLTYTFTPSGPAAGAGGVITGMTVGTSYTVTAGNGSCTSVASSSFSNAAMLETPAVPLISSTAATCSAAGSASITNYDAVYSYLFIPTGPTVNASGNITGFTTGVSYTVKAKNTDNCESAASASFTIGDALDAPLQPAVSVVAATCVAAGSASITNYISGYTYMFTPSDGISVSGSGNITGFTTGVSYTVKAKNADNCESAASASFTIEDALETPAVPLISSTAATCSAAGSSTISNYDAGLTYTFTPSGPAAGAGGAITGMVVGTSYTVTAGNGSCTSVASSSFSNATMLETPAVPQISSTAATCSAAGSSTISNYDAGLTYTFTPAGPAAGAGGAITGMTVGTSYTVTAGNGSCTSVASSSFSNAAMLETPAVPQISSTAATCSSAGSSTISNYVAGLTYTFTPAGPAAGAGGAITGMVVGTSYTVTAGNGSCTSVASSSFSNAAMLETPAVPLISSTAATCSSAGSITISNYVAGLTYTFTPSGPAAGAGGLITGMVVGTSYTVTAGNGSCTSVASSSFSNAAMLETPAVPLISSTVATCSSAGSITISNYVAGLTYTFTPSGPAAGAGGLITGMVVGTSYTVTAGNGSCTSVASASFSNAAMLETPAVPQISSTAATCSAAGSSTISNYVAGLTYTFTPSGPAAGAGGLITGMVVGTSYTVTAGNGSCTSVASSSFSNAAMLETPAVPQISSTAATCSSAGSSTISNYDAGLTYTFTPSGPAAGAGGVITGMTVGTSYTVTAGNGSCTSVASSSFSNAAMLETPAVPLISSTAATCSAAGSASITNYDAVYSYLFIPTGPTVNASGNITGFTTGVSYTVKAKNTDNCESAASASFTIGDALDAPLQPAVSVVAATCVAAGSASITNYISGYTYMFTPSDGISVSGSGNITGFTTGVSYTVKAKNADNCESAASASFTIEDALETPAVPLISSTAATCSAAGSSTISNYDAGLTYTFTPSGPAAGAGGAITGMVVGTSYTVTAGNGSCTSVASSSFSNATMLETPAVPQISSTAATCSAAGSSTISNYDAGLTYTFTPAGPAAGAGGAITGMVVGTSYTVTAGNGSCTSVASSSFSNAAMLETPAVPQISSTAATCSSAGSSTISNYDAGLTYTFTPSGPAAGAGGVITGMTVGTSYTVTAGNGSCTSVASSSFSNAAMLETPAVPLISSTAATCSAAGSSTISNYDAGLTYTFTPAGPAAGAGGAITGIVVGTSYTVTAGNGSCTSVASSSFSNAAMLETPAVPLISSTAATCSSAGSASITNYDAAYTYMFTPNDGISVSGSGNITGFTTGVSYTVKAKNASNCESAASATFTIEESLPIPTTPAITPNGPTEFYQGGSVTLTSSTGYSYLWSTGETTQSIVVNASGSFWVKVIDEKGCESEQSTPVTVNVLPVNHDCGGSVLGNTEVYSSVSYSPRRYAIPVTFAESGTINCITIYHNGGTGKVLTGVYADNTGTPTTLLGKTIAANVNSSEGWQTISLISPVEVQKGKTVWLTWVFENNPGVRETVGTPNKAYSYETWSNGMPDAFGHAYFANFKYSVYCNYTPKIEATNIGNTDIYGNTIKWGAQLAMPVTFSEAGEITSISIYHDGGTGSMLLGVYSDQGGFPSSRLAKTAITTVNPVAGWQTIQLPTPLQVVSGQKVWLSWVFQTVPAIHYTTGTPGRAASSNTWANQMPASFGTSTIAPTKYSIYCTFSTQGSQPDGIAPVVTAFNIPSASASLTVPVSSFTATDNKAVTGYKLTESATAPLAGDAGWNATAPVSYVFATSGTKTLYAWAKDAAGNVSAGISAQVIITLPDYNIGNTDIYGSTIKWGAQLAMPVTFSEAGEITSISIYHDGGTGSMLLGVYSDQGGFPSSRLAKTAITTVNPVAGWQTIQLPTPLQVVSGQKVWLSWVFQTVPAIHYTTGTPGRAASSNTWANQMPASFGTSTIAPTKYSIYCTFSTQGSQPDGIAPVVTAFNIPSASASLTVPVSSFTATDNKAVTGYKLTESATAPLAGDAGWNATAPVSYDFTTSGTKTLYAWAKDAAGNVSAGISAQVIITLPDYNIGNTDIYGSTIKWGAQLAMPVTFSEAGEITSISIYHDGGTGSMLLGVYSDQGGFPTTRLAKTAITTVNPVSGWQTIPLPTPLQVVSGQKVWLSWVFQTVPAIHYTTGTPGRAASSNTWANQMPTSFGTSTIAPTKYSIYCTYTTTKSAEIATSVIPDVNLSDLRVYPNPFSDRLHFEFVSPESVNARIDLYDMTGRMVKTIFEQPVESGVRYEAEFRPETIISGMYIYRITMGEKVTNGKVIFKKE